MKNLRAILFALLIVVVGCRKDDTPDNGDNALAKFNYETSTATQIDIDAPEYLAGSSFELYTANPDSGGQVLPAEYLMPTLVTRMN